jgi:tetratricopeptide (TPR) repeat protein
MKKRTDTDKNTQKRNQSLEDQIYDALIEKGWLIPQTEEDVHRAELALAQIECPPLPPELADPYWIIDRLDEAFEITANMTSAGIEDELCEMVVDPRRLSSLSVDEVPAKEGESKNMAYAYVSDESLDDEPMTDEVKHLILKLRDVSRQKCYGEALELARQATLLDPHCWRAWISYGSSLALLGNLDEGEAIFLRILEDFSDNPKAVAAALHGCAFAKEVRCELNPSEEDLREILPLYEGALRLDDSRSNTHASFLIYSALSCQLYKDEKLLEDSLQREDLFDAMKFETEERVSRGAKPYKFLPAFPIEFRNRLYGTGPSHFGSNGTNIT